MKTLVVLKSGLTSEYGNVEGVSYNKDSDSYVITGSSGAEVIVPRENINYIFNIPEVPTIELEEKGENN